MSKESIYNPEGVNVTVEIQKLKERVSKLEANQIKLRAKLNSVLNKEKDNKNYLSEIANAFKETSSKAKKEVNAVKPTGKAKQHPYYKEIVEFLSANFRPAKNKYIPREIVMQGRAWTMERIRQVISKNIAGHLADKDFLSPRSLSMMIKDAGLGAAGKMESGFTLERKIFTFYFIVRVQVGSEYDEF